MTLSAGAQTSRAAANLFGTATSVDLQASFVAAIQASVPSYDATGAISTIADSRGRSLSARKESDDGGDGRGSAFKGNNGNGSWHSWRTEVKSSSESAESVATTSTAPRLLSKKERDELAKANKEAADAAKKTAEAAKKLAEQAAKTIKVA